ncbi:unnamed protein product [Mytilus coruscus]|uniref:Uncharacterized protein n=1 Tax=Mytilus coruscus TaxID=42192 RepID=A0A6J8BK50_MYTCO|nr:unnamed protein product [Mytilus coruscus]
MEISEETLQKKNSIKRKDDSEVRFRFSLLHATTNIPNRIPVMVNISEKGERTCPGLESEFLQLPSMITKNAMVKTRHPLSTSGLTRLTQKNGKTESFDENRKASTSGIATLPPIVNRNDTHINRPLSASGFTKLPPINSSSKTTIMDRPMSSARLSPLLIAHENTANRPLSASGLPKLPPIIDGNIVEMCRPKSSLSGYSLLPPITRYKLDSVEDENVSVEGSDREELELTPNRAE